MNELVMSINPDVFMLLTSNLGTRTKYNIEPIFKIFVCFDDVIYIYVIGNERFLVPTIEFYSKVSYCFTVKMNDTIALPFHS